MKFFSLLFVLILNVVLIAPEAVTTDISITISNISGDEGKVLIGLYTEDTFMKSDPVKSALGTIKDGSTTVVFEDVEKGIYGIIALHDANSNGAMDFEANGMPKEAYGVSNNPFSFGPPQWEDAKFEVNGEENLALEIRF
ncbi:MAG TPA: DUF2141 domain-containing protein [Salinimicrobium sp.]|nr:DUF2141 domain-containing protein [Salinimicrobium sp.]